MANRRKHYVKRKGHGRFARVIGRKVVDFSKDTAGQSLMAVRGIRGAVAVARDEAGAILEATQDLLLAILEANPGLEQADIGSVFFTLTEDLTAIYPAQAARDLGWGLVPLLCGREIPVPGGLPRCIRVLIHWNTSLPQDAIQHVYLGEAACLRPDVNGLTFQE